MSLFVYKDSPDGKELLEARFPGGSAGSAVFQFKGAPFRYSHTSRDSLGKEYDVLLRPDENPKQEAADVDRRDEFAMAALVGYLSCRTEPGVISRPNVVAADSYRLADAMMEARKTPAPVKEPDYLRRERNALLRVVQLIPLEEHPLNPNDDGRPCVCSGCELARAAKDVLGMAEGRAAL